MIRVRYVPRVVEASEICEGELWYVNDPLTGEMNLDDVVFRECFENEFNNVQLTPKDLTEQLSQELQRWGMTPLPLDVPVEATLGLTLAAVRQITWDIKRIIRRLENGSDVLEDMKELVNCKP